jgi:hypothetical protein
VEYTVEQIKEAITKGRELYPVKITGECLGTGGEACFIGALYVGLGFEVPEDTFDELGYLISSAFVYDELDNHHVKGVLLSSLWNKNDSYAEYGFDDPDEAVISYLESL